MRLNQKKVCLLALLMVLSSNVLFAYELTFKLAPGAFFPFLSQGQNFAPVGFSGFFDTGVNIKNVFNVGPEFGFFIVPKDNSSQLPEGAEPNITVVPVGVHAEGYWFPMSRMEVSAGLALGISMAMNGRVTDYSPWGRVYGEAAFRINPSWSLGLEASFFTHQAYGIIGKPGIAGPSLGVSIKYRLDTEKITGKVNASISQDESVFPLMSKLYKENPFGTIYIENNESAEISNVKVYFHTENFTSSDLFCGEVGLIHKREVVEVPLVADFSDKIMMFSESGDIPGEIIVEYDLLGQKRKAVESVVVTVYNRNQVRWGDPNVIASYISTTSQEVLELSKYLVGIARNQLRSGLNRNMQFAMYLFEGIRLSNIECKPDNATPYATYHLDAEYLDYLQYPAQTLLYKSGDVDDVGILFMAMLESVGIGAGFIPMENDFIVLIDLKLDDSKVPTMFDGYDRVICMDGQAMIPVSMSTLREGFVNSWYNAVVEIMDAAENGGDASYYALADAWQFYPPATFDGGTSTGDKPVEAPLIAAVETDMSRYITTEFGPQIAAVQSQLATNGISVDLLNKLALLYVRAGMYSSAIPVYERSAAMGSVSAMNNLGNLATIQRRFEDAKLWYERALNLEPTNSTALKGLNRVLGQLEE